MPDAETFAKQLSRSRAWLGPSVAIVAVLLGIAWWLIADRSGFAPWQRQGFAMIEDVAAGRAKLDRESIEPDKLVAWLQEQSAPVLPTLPDALASARAIGAKAWEWRGLKFTLLSFRVRGSVTAHLVSTWHGGLKGAPPLGHMVHARSEKWHMATWSEGGLACLLATDAGEEALQELLAAVQGRSAPQPQLTACNFSTP